MGKSVVAFHQLKLRLSKSRGGNAGGLDLLSLAKPKSIGINWRHCVRINYENMGLLMSKSPQREKPVTVGAALIVDLNLKVLLLPRVMGAVNSLNKPVL
jgi:hypothetical protein